MEEAEGKQECLEGFWIVTVLKFLVTELDEGVEDVELQALRRLNGHLDPVL